MTQPDTPDAQAGIPAGPVDVPARRVTAALALGIVFMPLVFIWFVMRTGYSVRARVLAMGWLTTTFLTSQLIAGANHDAKLATSAPAASSPAVAQASATKAQDKHDPVKPAPKPPLTDPAREKRYIDLLDFSVEDARKKGDIYHEDKPMTSIQVSYSAMSTDGDIYLEGTKFALSAAGKARREAFHKEIGAVQARAFPRLRIMLASAFDEALWELDTDVEATGSNYDTLRFTSYRFATRRVIKSVMEQVHEDALAARFRRLEFRTYPGSAVTYYKLEPLPDSALATFAYNRWTRVD